MPTIHPTAIIERGATLGEGVAIGPYCHVGSAVTIDDGTELRSNVCVYGNTSIGEQCVVWPGAVLGGDPQDLKFAGEDSRLTIGDRNEIREHVTIHKGTDADTGVTTIGDDNLIMAYAHIAHDCVIGNHVIITNAVQLAGHVLVEDHAAIGGSSAVHHFVTIGAYAFVAGMTRVVHDVPPFMFVEGNPAKVRAVNSVAVQRHGLGTDALHALKHAWRLLYKNIAEGEGIGHTDAALTELKSAYPDQPQVQRVIASVQRSTTGTFGRYRESLRRDEKLKNPVK
ncbi:MAG: acyl-ACP--UDP-N-acetylglucosamine O-acyltransferase [Phycisphaeraceae bacterium]